MEQFTDLTFMRNIDLGDKANMSYRIKCLLNQTIDLTKYGDAVQAILLSPFIGSSFSPESEFDLNNKQLIIDFKITPQQAIDLNESAYFQLMLESFIQAMENMELPEGFDFETFKKDVLNLRFEQLQQAA